jgi:hypothetical protein
MSRVWFDPPDKGVGRVSEHFDESERCSSVSLKTERQLRRVGDDV